MSNHPPASATPGPVEPRRFRRVVGKIAAGLGLLVTFLVAVVTGVLLHLNLPAVHRLVVAQVNPILTTTFKGTIELDGIERLGWHGAGGVYGRVIDDEGVTVVIARNVRARLSVLDVLRSVIFGKGDMVISLSEIDIASADVNISTKPDGTLRLAAAFAPRVVSPPPKPGDRGTRVDLDLIDAKHLWVHGAYTTVPPMDVDADGVRASFHMTPKEMHIGVAELALIARGMPRGANPVGAVTAKLDMPSTTGKAQGVEATYRGTVGGAPLNANVWMDGDRLDAVADVPTTHADVIRKMAPEAPIVDDVSLHAEVRGDLPNLDIHAHTALGAATADIEGKLALGDLMSGNVSVDARNVNVHAFSPTSPTSSLAAKADLAFAMHAGGVIDGTVDVDAARGTFGGNAIPHASARGDYLVKPGLTTTEITAHGTAHVDEQGAPTDLTFAYLPAANGAQVVDVDARVAVPRLDATRMGAVATGRAAIHANGQLHLPDQTLTATIEGDVDGTSAKGARIDHAHITGRATGSAAAPTLATRIDATSLSMGSVAYKRAAVTADGIPGKLDVAVVLRGSNTAPDLDVHAHVEPLAGVRVTDARVAAKREGVVANVRVDEIRANGNVIEVKGGVVEGLGAPMAIEAEHDVTSTHARVAAPGIDLARIATLLNLENQLKTGTIAIDTDVTVTNRALNGALKLDVKHAVGYGAKDANAHFEATFAGRRLSATGHAAEGDFGSLDIKRADLEVAGDAPITATSWKQTWGDVDLDGVANLAKLTAVLPVSMQMPVADLRGRAHARVLFVRREDLHAPPTVHISAETSGLAMSSLPPEHAANGTRVHEAQGWHVEGVDGQVDARFDGPSEFGTVAARVVDKRGVLVALDGKFPKFPYADVLTSNDMITLLGNMPIAVSVDMPRRPLNTIPVIADQGGGDVSAMVTLTGTALTPVLDASARTYGVKSAQAPITSKIDAALMAHYEDGKGDVTLAASTPKAKVLEAKAHVDAIPSDFFGAAAKDDPPWKGSADVKLAAFPLGAVSVLNDRQVRGRVSGELVVANLHDNASAQAQLRVEGLEVGTTAFKTAQIDASIKDGAMKAVAQFASATGRADLNAEAGMTWGAAVAPSVDATKPTLVTFKATKFPIAAASPFAEPAVSDLSGTIEADARLSIAAGGQNPQASGFVQLHNGTINITTLGQEFHNVEAKLALSQDGILKLESVRMLGTTGEVMITGGARLDGLRVVNAVAAVRIPKSRPIPVGMQGVQMGMLYGDIKLAAASSKDASVTNINVDIPNLHVELPQQSPHSVQDLDEPKKVRVGMFRGKDDFVTLPIDGEDVKEAPDAAPSAPTTTNVAIHLGNDVLIERGPTLRIALDGDPQIHVSDKVTMSGQIHLKSGKLEVQGHTFEIEKGVVTFGNDPSNPEVVVTAGWTAPDGTRVFADFTGPVQTGKVTLRSEPGRPKNEILALILFGTADGSASTPYAQQQGNSGTQAGAAAGGLASAGLSQGLDKLTGLEVQTKVDTTDSANPRPEVEVQVAKDISLQVAFVLGTPPPGANPDRTFATVDWRFLRNWSLATTFGDQGSSIADVVWRYRY